MSGMFGLIARLVTGGVWLWAGLVKLPDLRASEAAVRGYQVLPESMVQLVGSVLPALEVLVGLCLLLGLWVRPAAVVSALLFVVFIAGIASVWARGIEIDCGCFGGGGAKEGASAQYPWEIARDLALLAASVWLVLRPRTRWALGSYLGHDVRDWGSAHTSATHVDRDDERHEDDDSGMVPDAGRDH